MITKRIVTVMASLFLISTLGWADFKYTQTSQITGGAMKSMMKGLGIFSKSMREATKPMESVTYVKGDYLRRDSADGSYEIIDLHGKRIINVNPQKQSYSVMTFEQMREAVQQMSQRMNEQMKREAHEKNANVTITPKIEVNPTGRSQTFLGQNAQEVMMKVKMEMQATDATHGTQSGSFDTSIDSWVAPSVSGYREIADFYKKMAMEINWTPRTADDGSHQPGCGRPGASPAANSLSATPSAVFEFLPGDRHPQRSCRQGHRRHVRRFRPFWA